MSSVTLACIIKNNQMHFCVVPFFIVYMPLCCFGLYLFCFSIKGMMKLTKIIELLCSFKRNILNVKAGAKAC